MNSNKIIYTKSDLIKLVCSVVNAEWGLDEFFKQEILKEIETGHNIMIPTKEQIEYILRKYIQKNAYKNFVKFAENYHPK